MKTLLITCAVLITKCHCKEISEEFPDITDLFPKPELNASISRRLNVDKKDLLFDLDTLDEKKFQKNVEVLKQQLMSENGTLEKTYKGRQMAPQRRYITATPLITPTLTINWSWKKYKGYHTHIWSMKIADLMVQFIYMARHKLMELDAQTIVKPKAENYRQVFLYKHLIRISDKLWDVHQIIRNQTRFYHGENENAFFGDVWKVLLNILLLHQKAVKLYVDFSYFWWVFVRIQEKFMERTHVVITRPPSTDFTFRTTASLHMKQMVDTDYVTEFEQYKTPGFLFFG